MQKKVVAREWVTHGPCQMMTESSCCGSRGGTKKWASRKFSGDWVLAWIYCNVCTPQAELTLRNPEAGSAYRLSPQSPVSKEAWIRLWGITTHIQAEGNKFPGKLVYIQCEKITWLVAVHSIMDLKKVRAQKCGMSMHGGCAWFVTSSILLTHTSQSVKTVHTYKIHEDLCRLSCGTFKSLGIAKHWIGTAPCGFNQPFISAEAGKGGTAIDSEVGTYPPQDPFFHCFSKV